MRANVVQWLERCLKWGFSLKAVWATRGGGSCCILRAFDSGGGGQTGKHTQLDKKRGCIEQIQKCNTLLFLSSTTPNNPHLHHPSFIPFLCFSPAPFRNPLFTCWFHWAHHCFRGLLGRLTLLPQSRPSQGIGRPHPPPKYG